MVFMYVVDELLRDLAGCLGRLGSAGWFPAASGNFSVFDRDEGRVYIKATGAHAGGFRSSDIVVIDLEGRKLWGEGQPSKEYRFHLGIYKARPELNAVIHGHPPYSTAFALAERVPPLVTGPSKTYLKKIPLVEYAPAGSEELARYVSEAFRDGDVRAVLLKRHGVVCAGRDIYDAVNIAEWLEDNSRAAVLVGLIKKLEL